MTPDEEAEIHRWFDAVQAAQPPESLALLFYTRDGRVYLGRGGVDVETHANGFDGNNLPMVMELATSAIGRLYDKAMQGASRATQRD